MKYKFVERDRYLYTFEREDGKTVQISIDPADTYTIGVSGRRLKRMMSATTVGYETTIGLILSENMRNYNELMDIVNRLLSLGYINITCSEYWMHPSNLRYIINNWREVIKALRSCRTTEDTIDIIKLQTIVTEAKITNLFTDEHRPTQREIQNFIHDLKFSGTVELLDNKKACNIILANYFGDLAMICGRQQILSCVKEYAEMCADLNIKLETGNFVRNYAKIKKSWLANQTKIENEKIERWQTRANFAYENDNYIVIVPTTKDEFVQEGLALNNCLGSWELENQILPQNRNAVFIRLKSEPTKSYIACDFDRQGRICQYYYKNNNDVRNGADREFADEYEAYVKKVLAELAEV